MKELDALSKRKRESDRRVEFHSAQISSLIYSANRSKDMPAKTIEDFMLDKISKPKPKKQSAAQMMHMAKLITKAFNGVIK